VLTVAFERVGVEPLFEPTAYYDRYDEYLASSADIHELRAQCFGDLAAETGHDRAMGVAVAQAFAEERDQRAVDPLPGVPLVLEELCERYRLGLVTNGDPAMQRRKLEGLGLEDRFDTLVFAGYETAPKPDAKPFSIALEALSTPPERACHVGNSLSSDVAGARRAGIRSVWVPDEPPSRDAGRTPTPDAVLESLEGFDPGRLFDELR